MCLVADLRFGHVGEFAVVNQHLLRDLMARNLWTEDIRNQIIAHNGSVQVRLALCK